MSVCPRCNIALSELKQNGVTCLVCGVCHGICLRGQDLRQQFGAVAQGVAEASSVYVPGVVHNCPTGCGAMRSREVSGPPPVHFEVCPMCTSVWFDHGEVAAIAKIMKRHKRERPREVAREFKGLTPIEEAKKELTLLENRQATGTDGEAVRSGTLWWLFAILTGLPVEGFNPVFRFPVVTWGLMITCCAAFAAQVHFGWSVIERYALVPADLVDGSRYGTVVTSIFLHGGAVHLIGNLYFLKVFGDNVEDRLGRVSFLVFYLLCGAGAGLAYAFVNSASQIPMVGASGAIAGLLGAYLVLFPDARISLVPGLLSLFQWIHLRALWYLPFWFGWQYLSSRLFPNGGVAWWAHMGGFIVGFVLAWIARGLISDVRLTSIATARAETNL